MAESHQGILHQGGAMKTETVDSDNRMIHNVGGENQQIQAQEGDQNQLIQTHEGDQNQLIQVHVVDESNHTVRVLNMDQHGLFSNS
jgi:hypothetical protein